MTCRASLAVEPSRAEILTRLACEMTALSGILLEVEESLFQGESALDHSALHGRDIQKIDLMQQTLSALTTILTALSHQELVSGEMELHGACRGITLRNLVQRLREGRDGIPIAAPAKWAGEAEFF